MASRPLMVAAVAAVLLLASVGADVAMNRTYFLDLREEGGYVTIVEQPYFYDAARPEPFREGYVEANRTDDVTLRVRVDNGYPWGFSDTYRVLVYGREVALGSLTAPAFGEGAAEFTVSVDTLLDSPSLREVAPGGKPVPVYAQVGVEVGGEILYGSFRVQEVSA